MKNIAIIGLGYVGLPLAIEFGKNRNVIGFDIDSERVTELRSHTDRTLECTAAQLRSAEHLVFTSNKEDLRSAEIYIITVPTPIDKAKLPNLDPLKSATKIVASVLKKGDIVIFESTVFPGATEEICVPLLEQLSHLKYNEDFFCGYSAERINPGDKIHTITSIMKVTSGSTSEIANEVDELYKTIITAGTYKAQSIKVAEAAKVIENTQRDLNIAFINELSLICQKLEIDTHAVLNAAKTKWNFLPFYPGLVGGHCIGVDPYYLTYKAEQLGYTPQVILAGRRINDSMAQHAATEIIKLMVKNGIDISRSKVGIMGITFKENCPDIRNSKVADLVSELESWNISTIVTDPLASHEAVYDEYEIALSEFEDLKDISALIIAVGHNEYQNLPMDKMRSIFRAGPMIVGDLMSIYDKQQLTDLGYQTFQL